MTLRTRLIASAAALMLLLGLAAAWGVRTLTADLTTALGETAASVGQSVFTVLRHERVRVDADGVAPRPAATPRDAARVGADATRIARRHESLQRDLIVLRDALPPRGDAAAAASGVDQRADPARLADELLEAHAELQVRHEIHGGAPTLVLRGDGFSRAIPLPRAAVDAALQRYTRQLAWLLLALLGAGLLLSTWLAHRIAHPLRALADAARAVGRGTLGAQAPDGGVPEVRETIAAFNSMSAQLRRLDAEAASLRADRELAELGEIGRGLAHSLRNPLHALGLSLEALAAQPVEAARALALAQSGREQLQRVDQALRGFLALSAGQGATPLPVSLRGSIDDVLLEASQRADGRVHFVRDGDDASLEAVPAELRVMLHALVINALEASPDGAAVTVRIARSDGEARVAIDVIDEGSGIDDAIRARLFQPHVSSKAHGAGMGLFLAERLARSRYAGGITFAPHAPRGTRARLSLGPREAAHG